MTGTNKTVGAPLMMKSNLRGEVMLDMGDAVR
jgi:hypothetical protein